MKSSHRATKPLRFAQAPIVNVKLFIADTLPANEGFSKLTAKGAVVQFEYPAIY